MSTAPVTRSRELFPAASPQAPVDAEQASAARGSGILSLAFLVVGGGNYAFSAALAYVLSQGAYGVVALVQGFLLFAAWFTSAGFPWTVARRLSHTSDPIEQARAVRGAMVGNLVVATLLGGLLLIVVGTGTLRLGGESAWPLVLAAMACSVAGVNAAGKGALQGLFSFRAVAAVNIVEIVVKLAVGLGLAAAGAGPTGAAIGILAGLVVATGISLVLLRRLPLLRTHGLGGRELVVETLPLFLGTAGMALLTSIDLFGIKVLTPGDRSNTVAGLYQAAVTLGRIPYFFASALTTAVFPHVSRTRADREASGLYVRKGALYVIALLAPISLVFIALPHAALAALYPDPYDDAAPALRLTALGTTFLALAAFLLGSLQATGRDRKPAVVVLGAVGLEAVALAIGVPIGAGRGSDGALLAASASFVAATSTAALVLYVMCWRTFGWRPRWRGAYAFCIAAGAMLVVLLTLPHGSRLTFGLNIVAAFAVYGVVAAALGLLSQGDLRTLRSGIPGLARRPVPASIAAGSLEIVCHSGSRALDDARPAWEEVLAESEGASPFVRPAWLRAWWRVYGRGRDARVLEVRRAGRPVALAFLQVTPTAGLGTRRLGFMGGAAGDRAIWLANPFSLGAAYYNDILVAAGHDADAVAGLRAWLEATVRDWDEIRLTAVPAASTVTSSAATLFAGWAFDEKVEERRIIDTSVGWDAYYASCGSRQRRHLRYERNALDRAVGGGLQDEWVHGPGVTAAMEEFLELHARRWAAERKPGLQSGEGELYRELAAAAPEELVVLRLRAGDRVVAMQWGFDDGRTYTPYNFAFDPELARQSPSNVLLQLAIARCCEDGHAAVDLAGLGTAAHWTEGRRTRVTIRVSSPRAAARRRAALLGLVERTAAAAQATSTGRRARGALAAIVAALRRVARAGPAVEPSAGSNGAMTGGGGAIDGQRPENEAP